MFTTMKKLDFSKQMYKVLGSYKSKESQCQWTLAVLRSETKGIWRLSLFTGLDYWTGILDWTTGLKFFPFLDKIMWFFKYLTPGDLNHYF